MAASLTLRVNLISESDLICPGVFTGQRRLKHKIQFFHFHESALIVTLRAPEWRGESRIQGCVSLVNSIVAQTEQFIRTSSHLISSHLTAPGQNDVRRYKRMLHFPTVPMLCRIHQLRPKQTKYNVMFGGPIFLFE